MCVCVCNTAACFTGHGNSRVTLASSRHYSRLCETYSECTGHRLRCGLMSRRLLRMQRPLTRATRGHAVFTACFPTIVVKHRRAAGKDRNRRLAWISGFIVESNVRAASPVHPSIHPFTALAIRIDRHRLTETGFH